MIEAESRPKAPPGFADAAVVPLPPHAASPSVTAASPAVIAAVRALEMAFIVFLYLARPRQSRLALHGDYSARG